MLNFALQRPQKSNTDMINPVCFIANEHFSKQCRMVLICLLMVTSCENDKHKNVDSTPPSMILPVADANDFLYISRIYSSVTTSPIGAIHRGLDFAPDGNLKEFQSVFDGVVTDIRLFENVGSGTWQVNVHIDHNNRYGVEYAFEPCSANQADGQIQLDNILVSKGDHVSTSQVIGRLYTTNSNSHVHFSFFEDQQMRCPEEFWTDEARETILDLIHACNPDWHMCY